jgi:hypothetical protein
VSDVRTFCPCSFPCSLLQIQSRHCIPISSLILFTDCRVALGRIVSLFLLHLNPCLHSQQISVFLPVQSLTFLLHTLVPCPAYRTTRIRPERMVLVRGCSRRYPLPAFLRASKQQQLDVASINAVGSETGRDKSWIAPSLGMPCQARRVTPQS